MNSRLRLGRTPSSPRDRTSLASSLRWFAVGRATSIAGVVGANLLAARLLGVEAFGAFATLTALATLVGLLATLGTNRGSLRDAAAATALHDSSRWTDVVLMIRAVEWIALPAVAAASAIIAYLVAGGPLRWLLATGFAALVFGNARQKLWADVLRSLGSVRASNLMQGRQGGAATALLQAGLLGLLLMASIDELAVTIAAMAVGFLLALLPLGPRIRRALGPLHVVPPSLHGLRLAFSRGWAFAGTQVAAQLNFNAELLIAGAVLSTVESSQFAGAHRLVHFLVLPFASGQIVFAPMIARHYAKGSLHSIESSLRTVATITSLAAGLGLALFIAFPTFSLTAALGEDFAGAAGLLVIMAAGQFTNVFSGLCGITLSMTAHERPAFKIAGSVAVSRLLLAWPAAMLFGPIGLAILSAVATAVLYTLFWWTTHKALGIWTHPTLRPRLHNLLQQGS